MGVWNTSFSFASTASSYDDVFEFGEEGGCDYTDSRDSTLPSIEAVTNKSICVRFPATASMTTTSRRFHASFLRSQHPDHFHESSGQHWRSLVDVDCHEVVSAEIVPSNSKQHPVACWHPISTVYETESTLSQGSRWKLHVEWNNGESSSFPGEWLQHYMQCPRHWQITPHQAIRKGSIVHSATYRDVERDDDTAFSLLHALLKNGAVLVRESPLVENCVARLATRLAGGTSHGNLYGDVFTVETIPSAENIAYTGQGLAPHQDLAYFQAPPGLQFLQCWKAAEGASGASTLVDALAAAYMLRESHPRAFEVLKTVPATFLKQRPGADMIYRRPHIEVDSEDVVTAVHWSPPFEGPLVWCDGHVSTDEYFQSRAIFEQLVDNQLEGGSSTYSQNATWEYALQPGEVLIFNNLRMLHGRTSIRNAQQPRKLVGCYASADIALGRYRLWKRDREENDWHAIPCIGNGTSTIW